MRGHLARREFAKSIDECLTWRRRTCAATWRAASSRGGWQRGGRWRPRPRASSPPGRTRRFERARFLRARSDRLGGAQPLKHPGWTLLLVGCFGCSRCLMMLGSAAFLPQVQCLSTRYTMLVLCFLPYVDCAHAWTRSSAVCVMCNLLDGERMGCCCVATRRGSGVHTALLRAPAREAERGGRGGAGGCVRAPGAAAIPSHAGAQQSSSRSALSFHNLPPKAVRDHHCTSG